MSAWVCPLCGTANAPLLLQCPCRSTTASNSSTTAASSSKHRSKPDAGKVLDLRSKPPRQRNDYTNPSFARFWEVYPVRRGKAAAYRNWMRYVVDAGVDVDAVIAAAAAYRDDPHRDPLKTKWAEGWLSTARWEDDYTVTKPTAQQVGHGVTTIEDREAEWRRAEEDTG